MSEGQFYTTQLQAGLGLIGETKSLLRRWQPGMSTQDLYNDALDSGEFPHVTSRRLRNIVAECFAPRFLNSDYKPVHWLQLLNDKISERSLNQMFFIFTARANLIFRDFVTEIYWDKYASGYIDLASEDAQDFIHRANVDGKTKQLWSDTTKKRQASYLIGACMDYGLLKKLNRTTREITSIRIDPKTVILLAYDLHLQGIQDNNLINHRDWFLFGLDRDAVLDEIKRLSVYKLWIIQVAADVVSISWAYKTMEEVVDVVIEAGL